jgi:murein DD-endopeptidase MepM/ murein hydrolase activator NlpD
VLYLLVGRQAVPFFLFMTALLVASSSIYAKGLSEEKNPGERSILFSLLRGDREELIFEKEARTGFSGDNINASAVFANQAPDSDHPTDAEGELLPLVIGGGAVMQPVISSASPSAAPRTKIENYVVKPGDTPGGIAERFGIKLTTLYWANNLSAYSYIRVGQGLKIPPVDGVIYTVRKGDTVARLATTYRSESEKIISYNRLGANEKLSPGMVLVIPNGKPPPPPPPIRSAPVKNLIASPTANQLPGGKLLWPLLGTSSNNGRYITQYFRWLHTGVDIDGDYSNPVVSSDAGLVQLVNYGRTGYGLQVVIDHENGIKTRYAHLSKILVEAGQRVERGQQVGVVGTTGRSTGTHIHYEVFVNGRRVNPLGYIR